MKNFILLQFVSESDSRSLNSLTDEKTESKIASVPSNNVIVNGRYEGSNNSSVEHLAPTVENGFQSESEFRSVSSAVSESAATDDPSSEKDLYQIMLKGATRKIISNFIIFLLICKFLIATKNLYFHKFSVLRRKPSLKLN